MIKITIQDGTYPETRYVHPDDIRQVKVGGADGARVYLRTGASGTWHSVRESVRDIVNALEADS